MKRVFAFVSVAVMAGVLGVNVYHSIVDVRSWGSSMPDSIITARSYFRVVNPGTFFRIVSPLNQLAALVVLIACWKSGKRARLSFGSAFLFAVLAEVLTVTYFFPRNELLFSDTTENAAVMIRAWSEWSQMNWVRNGILALALMSSMTGLDSLYRRREAHDSRSSELPAGLAAPSPG